jgi:hypothetical protein
MSGPDVGHRNISSVNSAYSSSLPLFGVLLAALNSAPYRAIANRSWPVPGELILDIVASFERKVTILLLVKTAEWDFR